ncbi:unnamed protein product [Leuciscus chuanchicus]
MQDKEKSIYDLKRGNSALNNSLEFTKFSYELTKEELAAKNHQTEELKEQIQESKMKENMKRYSTDALFQKKRYSTDALFQKKMKEYSKKRYSTDALFQKKKEYIKKRYSTDTLFQRKMKAYMVKRYAVALPKGQQRAVRGAVVCVPSEMEKTVNSLPRPRSEAQLLQVKLKRHVKFKGYQHFHTVNMHNVLAALSKLKAMHSEYRDISIRESAVFESPLEEEADVSESHLDEEAEVSEMQQEVDVAEQDEQHVSVEEKDELRPGLTLDTCMQPPDIGHEILSYGEGIFSIAPAQGQKPVGFFKIPKLEAMAFPVQFPTGQNSIDEERQISISPSMYFNARLFSVDTRFAKDQSYLFFAQFVIETQLARNSMSIQLRKGKPLTRDGRRISNRLLQDNREIERLVHNKDATRFMQPLRGSPSYWEKTLRDLQAMIRQLGTPTVFLHIQCSRNEMA